MIENVWAGFISAVQMLLISTGIFIAWGAGFYLRERSRDMQRTYRNAVIVLMCAAAVLSLLTGSGNMAKALVYWLVVIGVPLAIGLGPTEQAWDWIRQGDAGNSGRGGGGAGGAGSPGGGSGGRPGGPHEGGGF